MAIIKWAPLSELDRFFDDTLRITGRRAEEQEMEGKNYYRKEIRRGSFSRAMGLPRKVDGEKAVAEYRDGILTVRMPFVGGVKPKVVKVRAGRG